MPLEKLRRNYSPANLKRVREFRRAMTRAEKRLWYDGLAGGKLGLSFRRQHPLGLYSLDFYCVEARLCVEVDGDSHGETVARDAKRDRVLNEAGILTLRVTNRQVFESLPWVLQEIEKLGLERCGGPWAGCLQGLPEPPPYPPPAPRCAAEQGEALETP
jgi:very-short-patch-repair endonuclease